MITGESKSTTQNLSADKALWRNLLRGRFYGEMIATIEALSISMRGHGKHWLCSGRSSNGNTGTLIKEKRLLAPAQLSLHSPIR